MSLPVKLYLITTTSPATISRKIVRNLTATKNPDSLVLVFVLIEFNVVITASTSTDNNLCVIGGAGSLTPKLEYTLSTNTILRIASVAGIVATIQLHAAMYPQNSPKI